MMGEVVFFVITMVIIQVALTIEEKVKAKK